MTQDEGAGAAQAASDYVMQFDPGAIKHLGLQMYSTLPPVISELVANAWDAGASRVEITIPDGALDDGSEIVVSDDGDGMSDSDLRERYLVVGRDRRAEEGTDQRTAPSRMVMGRKGIGKFAGFGIARQVEVESARDNSAARLLMDYGVIENAAKTARRVVTFPHTEPTGEVSKGTRVVLRGITKYRTRSIAVDGLRKSLARRFSVIGNGFEVAINGSDITAEERDLKALLEVGQDGEKYLWEYDDVEISPDSGWRVDGWIGALSRTNKALDGIARGVVIMARGKLVQEPFVFQATVGQQYALSYLVGEIHAEFVDGVDDTVGTARSTLVWDAPQNDALLTWGATQVQAIAREWAERRAGDNERRLAENPLYKKFLDETEQHDNPRAKKIADKLIRSIVSRNVTAQDSESDEVVQMCIDFVEFDAFWELAEALTEAKTTTDPIELARLFREWEIVEAKEMARVTKGRIATIQKLSDLIAANALEVPILHNFLKEFPWVIDPRWLLVDDETQYSELLRQKFPESSDVPEEDRRIDFLCVNEGETLVVVEIKRPHSKASKKELDQIEDYVSFVRDLCRKSTDPASPNTVVGYLLCGGVVDTFQARERVNNLAKAEIYVRPYGRLLEMVRRSHNEFLERYERLRAVRAAADVDVAAAAQTSDPTAVPTD